MGKTYITSLLAESLRYSGMRTGVYKPVASGCREENGLRIADDAVQLWQAAGKPQTLDDVCPQKFLAPLAPPTAATLENSEVDKERLIGGVDSWLSDFDVTLIEGAGGLFSPIADGMLNIDLVLRLAPVDLIIVAANRLGVIHQVVSTCRAAESNGIVPIGIVLCDVSFDGDTSRESNAQEITKYTRVPVLGAVTFNAEFRSIGGIASYLMSSCSKDSPLS